MSGSRCASFRALGMFYSDLDPMCHTCEGQGHQASEAVRDGEGPHGSVPHPGPAWRPQALGPPEGVLACPAIRSSAMPSATGCRERSCPKRHVVPQEGACWDPRPGTHRRAGWESRGEDKQPEEQGGRGASARPVEAALCRACQACLVESGWGARAGLPLPLGVCASCFLLLTTRYQRRDKSKRK